MLDTGILRELVNPKPHKNVVAWLQSVSALDLAVSALSVRESSAGIANLAVSKPDQAAQIAQSIKDLYDSFADRILPADRAVAAAWGEMLAKKAKHVDDTGIAATAADHGLTLVTRNVKDYKGRGIRMLNPYKAA